MGDHGVGPCASFLSGKRSTAELITQQVTIISNLEARAGIEPAHGSFADSCVTTSPTRHNTKTYSSATLPALLPYTSFRGLMVGNLAHLNTLANQPINTRKQCHNTKNLLFSPITCVSPAGIDRLLNSQIGICS